MHSPSSDLPDIELPSATTEERLHTREAPVVAPKPERRRKYLILFLLTIVTTTLAGADFWLGFVTDFGQRPPELPFARLLANGLWFAVPALLILGAHEFGHYFACRYYGVSSSLPYFLPLWIPAPVPQFGTLGAVIRIREPIRLKRQLFDIGIAGPLAGFLVLVPVLLIGLGQSRVVPLPDDFRGFEFGEPLLFRFFSWLRFGSIPDGYSVQLHPMGWAAWFGMLATALNLTPIGQLDGGHISYAVLGRRSGLVTMTAVLGLVGLSVWSRGAYMLWTVLVIVMLWVFGVHHPRAIDEADPLDAPRLWLAAVAAAMFVVSFTPIPSTVIGFD
jgi:membrane-associated protease RseP (regulator of RpoE activity)